MKKVKDIVQGLLELSKRIMNESNIVCTSEKNNAKINCFISVKLLKCDLMLLYLYQLLLIPKV